MRRAGLGDRDPAVARPGRALCSGLLLTLAVSALLDASESRPLTILDVPFIAQSELLCGGAAAAMVMRYWGERGVDAESFSDLVDRHAGGIRTSTLAADMRARGWQAVEETGSRDALSRELERGRPVIVLLEDRPGTFHYVVVVASSGEGVVFHDPARAPFRVGSADDFERRWSAAGRWMLVATPSIPRSGTLSEPPAVVASSASTADPGGEPTTCDQIIAEGVRQAQANDLASAERTLASAMSCGGPAAFRELAGIRLLQRRWPEATDLAAAAVQRDPSDTYAWKLLATARFVGDDRLAALDAWNHAGEPRIDIVRLDGLRRTRHEAVQRLIGLNAGQLLTRRALERANRRLSEMPAAPGVLDYQPAPSGLADVRGLIVEQPLLPHGAVEFGVLSLATAITRELVVSLSSPTGGGEQLSFDWRFWTHRPRYQLSLAAPAPWRGVWKLTASRERQPFTAVFSRSLHDSAQLDVADWLTGSARWQAGVGADRWDDSDTLGTMTGGIRLVGAGDRLDARIQGRTWVGHAQRFETGEALVVARSSTRQIGTVVIATGGVHAATASAPPDLWFAGDTGRARPLLLRAHPILDSGERFRTERLGRLIGNGSAEVQHWWRVGPFRLGGATFADAARTSHRLAGPGMTDVDIGVGFRGAYPGKAGTFRADLARGLRDGETALSFVYSPSSQ